MFIFSYLPFWCISLERINAETPGLNDIENIPYFYKNVNVYPMMKEENIQNAQKTFRQGACT